MDGPAGSVDEPVDGPAGTPAAAAAEPPGAPPPGGTAPPGVSASAGGRVEVQQRLDRAAVRQVRELIDAATTADGVRPLSEHVMLHLRHGGDADTRHLLALDDTGALVGYAHLDVTDIVAGPSAELVVHPMARGRGYGRALTEALSDLAGRQGRGPLRLWSHGAHRSARELAHRMGFTHVRSLWQLRRSLYAPIPPARLPHGVAVRAFEPGRDEPGWLALNERAFAGHPEQAGWNLGDLQQRMAEPWFDPDGFLLAERDGRLVGFHWTKVHGGSPDDTGHDQHGHDQHGHDPIGEVYVLGVDPDEGGSGIGRALTVLGLVHLRARGLGEAMLYVDEDNTVAIRLYESLGFTHWDTDVMYARDAVPRRATR